MSLPEFPTITPPLTREDAINQIISSIAMEELALSHIINAEGEKLQYILGTIPGMTGPQPTIQEVLDVNQSVRSVLESAAEVQAALRSKLQTALSSAVLRGPTGPTGEPGIVNASGFQASMFNADSIIASGDTFKFNEVLYNEGTDISYDATTGDITLNQDAVYSFYVLSFWFYSDGYDDIFPYTITLYQNGTPYSILSVPYIETQINSTIIIPVAADPITINIANSSIANISLPDEGSQARVTIIGYKSN